ncbi:hypothetical protein [Xenorhabdus kozodoii]|nr:hypothetical protein [Xenorhabdus kozodoii]
MAIKKCEDGRYLLDIRPVGRRGITPEITISVRYLMRLFMP